jgi:hypothetical protein
MNRTINNLNNYFIKEQRIPSLRNAGNTAHRIKKPPSVIHLIKSVIGAG